MSMTTYCLATTMVIMILMYLVIVAPPHSGSVLRLMRCDPQHAAQAAAILQITAKTFVQLILVSDPIFNINIS